MPVYRLDERLIFPPPERGPRRGPIAVGGDLSPARLLLAYSMGIFPWESDPLLWHSPDPRMVLLASELHVSRSLEKAVRRGAYRVTLDTAFAEVMVACASVPRRDQDGTWITPEMVDSYGELHRRGIAHSVETWDADRLVGGLYGLSLGAAFFGESMFARATDASKLAFVSLVRQLERWAIPLVDCQVHTHHLASLGAREWPRRAYLDALRRALEKPTRLGPWRFDATADGGTGARVNDASGGGARPGLHAPAREGARSPGAAGSRGRAAGR
jgi:leucyl/phenylalanyl-tRNA--protein transferase